MTDRKDILKLIENGELPWTMTGIGRIPCTVYQGMFSDERGVVVEIGERTISLFAPIDAILLEESGGNPHSAIQGHLKVRIVKTIEDNVVVDLPGDSFQAGTRIVVPRSLLSPAEPAEKGK